MGIVSKRLPPLLVALLLATICPLPAQAQGEPPLRVYIEPLDVNAQADAKLLEDAKRVEQLIQAIRDGATKASKPVVLELVATPADAQIGLHRITVSRLATGFVSVAGNVSIGGRIRAYLSGTDPRDIAIAASRLGFELAAFIFYNPELVRGLAPPVPSAPSEIQQLRHRDPVFRARAALNLAALGKEAGPSAVPALLEIVADKQGVMVRDVSGIRSTSPGAEAAAALVALGAVNEVVNVLRTSRDGEARKHAVRALCLPALAANASVVSAVTDALTEGDWGLRGETAVHIDKLVGKERAVDLLIERLADGNGYVRNSAWATLMRLTGQKLPNDRKAWERWRSGGKETSHLVTFHSSDGSMLPVLRWPPSLRSRNPAIWRS